MSRRISLRGALLAAVMLPSAGALAGNEEEDTQAPAVSPTPFVSSGAAVQDSGKDRPFARQLTGEPDPVKSTFRWWIPVAGKKWTGGHAADVSTSREGMVRAWASSPDGKRLELRARADNRPLAFRTRVPFTESALEEAGTHRESARLVFSAPIASRNGGYEIYADWRGGGGLRPSTSAAYAPGETGPAFLAPAWRRGDHGSASAGGRVFGQLGGARVALDGRIADESMRTSFRAPDRLAQSGGLTLSNDERRRVAEAGISADLPMGSLLAGGSYRIGAMQAEGGGGRRQDTPDALPGETHLDDTDLRSLTHRGSLGVAFLPLPSVRTGITATAISHQLRGDSLERRNLADDSVSRGSANVDRWSTGIAADATWFAMSWLSADARANVETSRLDDEWTQTLLAPGGSGVVSRREQEITRDRTFSKLEASVTAGPWRGVRATAGASSERESHDLTSSRAVDSPLFDDRSRDRTTMFAQLRARPAAGLSLDARAKTFTEERDLGGTQPTRHGSELRGRATFARAGASVFGVAALTEDRYELPSLPPDAEALEFLPIEFDGRSWIASSGFAFPITETWRMSASATRVLQAGDLDARLLDVAAEVGGPINERLRISGGVRQLTWDDDRAPWGDADAVVGFVLFSGSL